MIEIITEEEWHNVPAPNETNYLTSGYKKYQGITYEWLFGLYIKHDAQGAKDFEDAISQDRPVDLKETITMINRQKILEAL
jgi:hypothetical protein